MKLNILIVEDEKMLREMLAQLAEIGGHSVTQANSAVEAIRLLDHNDYDVVLTDNDMPAPNEGMKVIECARLSSYRPHIIWMSGRASGNPTLVQKALEQGADAVLYKPFEMKEFMTIIQEATARKVLDVVPV